MIEEKINVIGDGSLTAFRKKFAEMLKPNPSVDDTF